MVAGAAMVEAEVRRKLWFAGRRWQNYKRFQKVWHFKGLPLF
jgi:hypothetical protein